MAYTYDWRRRTAMEFPSEEALKKYLKEHPKADRSKHTVSHGAFKSNPKSTEGKREKAYEGVRSKLKNKRLDDVPIDDDLVKATEHAIGLGDDTLLRSISMHVRWEGNPGEKRVPTSADAKKKITELIEAHPEVDMGRLNEMHPDEDYTKTELDAQNRIPKHLEEEMLEEMSRKRPKGPEKPGKYPSAFTPFRNTKILDNVIRDFTTPKSRK